MDLRYLAMPFPSMWELLTSDVPGFIADLRSVLLFQWAISRTVYKRCTLYLTDIENVMHHELVSSSPVCFKQRTRGQHVGADSLKNAKGNEWVHVRNSGRVNGLHLSASLRDQVKWPNTPLTHLIENQILGSCVPAQCRLAICEFFGIVDQQGTGYT